MPPAAGTAPISPKVQATAALPLTDFPVEPIVIVLPVPQLAVVISAEWSNEVPLIFLAVAVAAVPVKLPVTFPVTFAVKVPSNDAFPAQSTLNNSVFNSPEPAACCVTPSQVCLLNENAPLPSLPV